MPTATLSLLLLTMSSSFLQTSDSHEDVAAVQEPSPGISQALARQRCRDISGLRYELHFRCRQGGDTVEGSVRMLFDLTEDAARRPLTVDFAGEGLAELRINGKGSDDVRRLHNHLVLPSAALRAGRNELSASFTAAVAATGTPVSVYRDPDNGEEFLYTLLVPADAHRLFPCFDQPDLKAVFQLCLDVPGTWTAVGNAPLRQAAVSDGEQQRFDFAETAPLPTYLFAFAAGPFDVVVAGETVQPPLRLFVRRSKRAEMDGDALISMHSRSVQWLEDYFARPYPFGKLDAVLLPGFPYGGMEHAGAIFYRETALTFDHRPTDNELLRRSTLVYHEVSHQWFGNLVTMAWFDDLWLKEGFATWVSYRLLEALEPERHAWLRFLQDVKPSAYRVDVTTGTTPVYQELDNLADAKSAYGAIVYNKAPAVLRELQGRLGEEAFRDGMRRFLAEHAFGNARWQDLVRAFEAASKSKIDAWSDRWILAAGMPKVSVEWRADQDGRISEFRLQQQATVGGGVWPLQLQMLLFDAEGHRQIETVRSSTGDQSIADMIGRQQPACVLLNPDDVAYGQFLLDPSSREYLRRHLPGWKEPLLRSVALTALFDTVREGAMDPREYVDLACSMLGDEQDAASHFWLLQTLATTVSRYLQPETARAAVQRLSAELIPRLRQGMGPLALHTLRVLVRLSGEPAVLELCADLLRGTAVPGLELGMADRYLMLAALLAHGDAADLQPSMTGAATPPGGEKYAYLALAARRDPESKKQQFASYLQLDQPPEQWMQESLSYFHWAGHEQLTLPFLARALERVEWVKEHRRIFFMPAWIDAFVNGHSNRAALDVVDDFLAGRADLSIDIRRKLLESVDDLRRAVRIKDRWK